MTRTQLRSTALSPEVVGAPLSTPAPLAAPATLAAPSVPVAVPALTGTIALPTRILVCPWGTSYDLAGNEVTVNDETLALLGGLQAQLGYAEIALDFNHATVSPRDSQGGLPIYVAGYGVPTVVKDEGIYLTMTAWTPEGEQAWTGRHYRDLSPTVAKNAANVVIFLHSVALCRQGQISGLTAYAAAAELPRPLAPLTPPQSTPTMIDYKSALLKSLKLADDASDEQIAAALAATAATVKDDDDAGTVLELDALAVTSIITRLDQIERNNIVDRATAEGKIIPLSASEISATPVETLRAMSARLTPTVPLAGATLHATATAQSSVLTALSANEKTICATLNITEEQYRATL